VFHNAERLREYGREKRAAHFHSSWEVKNMIVRLSIMGGAHTYLVSEGIQLDKPVTPEIKVPLLITHGTHKLFEHPDNLLVVRNTNALMIEQLQLQQ
jgi:hypothetical protein